MHPASNSSPASDLGLHFLNTRIVVRCSAMNGAGGVSVQEHWMPFGDSPPLHQHTTDDEIFHILVGAFRFRIGDDEITAKPGDTVLAPKGVPHSYRVDSEEGGHCLVIAPGSAFESFVCEMARPAPVAELPAPDAPSSELQRRLIETGARHGIEILGPPMDAA